MKTVIYLGKDVISHIENFQLPGLKTHDYICIFCGSMYEKQETICLCERTLEFSSLYRQDKNKKNEFIENNRVFFIEKTGSHNRHLFNNKEEHNKFLENKKLVADQNKATIMLNQEQNRIREERYKKEQDAEKEKIDMIRKIVFPKISYHNNITLEDLSLYEILTNISEILKYMTAKDFQYFMNKNYRDLIKKVIEEEIESGNISSNIYYY